MAALTDLQQLLATMQPRAREGEFVYVVVPDDAGQDLAGELGAEAMVREDEGMTLVVRREVADRAGLAYDFVGAWITLTVHSSLEAVGLTAAFATALTRAGISCNVVAGFHHDHLLVPVADRDRAVRVLRDLSRSGG
jgi:uncharacterized protein